MSRIRPATSPTLSRTRPGIRSGNILSRSGLLAAAVGLSFAVATPAIATPAASPAAGRGDRFPTTITLPNDAVAGDLGYQPEGIAVKGTTAYVGSLVDGTITATDLRTGVTTPLVAPDGDPAVGVEAMGKLLLVAGGPSGELRVYDRTSGGQIAVYTIPDAGFINDIAVAGDTAYFTDSQRAVLYALPLSGGTVGQPTKLPLSGDFALSSAPGAFNANGIAALDKNTLIVGQSTDPDGSNSALYAVNASTGVATRVQVTGGDVTNADGIIIRGRTLFVVQNRANSIVELTLGRDGTTATVVRTLTDSDFAVPTTVDFGPKGGLYAVNAKFGTVGTDAVHYDIVRVAR